MTTATQSQERTTERLHRVRYGRTSVTFFLHLTRGSVYPVSSYSYQKDGETQWHDGVSADLLLEHAECNRMAANWWNNDDSAFSARKRAADIRRRNSG